VQGNCTDPSPLKGTRAPLASLLPGQCVLTVEATLFNSNESGAAEVVWLHGLYVDATTVSVQNYPLLNWVPSTPTSKLYMTQVTLHGGFDGLFAGRSAYMSGVPFAVGSSAAVLFSVYGLQR
jgi:hypothetical protein